MNRGVIFALGCTLGALMVAAGAMPVSFLLLVAALYFGAYDEMRR
jgi:hypothetical protein